MAHIMRVDEMAVNIKRNDYKQTTECREEVVQAICDAFLKNCAWSRFRPYNDGVGRNPTLYVIGHNKNDWYGFNGNPFSSDKAYYRIRECEMKEAIRLLVEAGYHVWKYYQYRDSRVKSYKVTKSPNIDDRSAVEVFSFDDHFDD